MKRTIVAVLLVMMSFAAFAQKLRPSDIPQEVRLGLENTYSDYKLNGWYSSAYKAFIYGWSC